MAVWTDLSSAFGYGTKLTSTQQQQLRDNITALAEGASGAPEIAGGAITPGSVGTTEIGNSAVGHAELRTSTGSVSNNGVSLSNYTLPGAEYGFYPRIKMNMV